MTENVSATLNHAGVINANILFFFPSESHQSLKFQFQTKLYKRQRASVEKVCYAGVGECLLAGNSLGPFRPVAFQHFNKWTPPKKKRFILDKINVYSCYAAEAETNIVSSMNNVSIVSSSFPSFQVTNTCI